MKVYKHIVQYYETDRMGITHHSNYIRWMEEARVNFLAQIGWDYEKLEDMGIMSPVTALDCKYKMSSTFADEISIKVKVEDFKGVRLKLYYEMTNEFGEVLCEAHSEHCFLGEDGKPMSVKREHPDFYTALVALID